MAKQMEDNLAAAKEYAFEKSKKAARKDAKKKALVEQQRQRLDDVSEDEAMRNDELLKGAKHSGSEASSENDNDLEDAYVSDSSEEGVFVNPLLAAKLDKEGEDEDEAEESKEELSPGGSEGHRRTEVSGSMERRAVRGHRGSSDDRLVEVEEGRLHSLDPTSRSGLEGSGGPDSDFRSTAGERRQQGNGGHWRRTSYG